MYATLFTMCHAHHFPDKQAGHNGVKLISYISKQTSMKVMNSGVTTAKFKVDH